MQNRIIQIIALALLVAFVSPVAAAQDERAGHKTAFSAAYAVYLAAVDAEDTKATVVAAEKVLELGKIVYADDSAEMAAFYIRLGTAHHAVRHHEEAISALKEGLSRYEALYGREDEQILVPLRLLARSARYDFSGETDAQKVQKRVLRLVAAIHGELSEMFADVSMEMGEMIYFSHLNTRASKKYFQDAYDIYSAQNISPNQQAAHAAFWLGKAAQQRRSRRAAEKHFLDSLSLMEGTDVPGHDVQLLAHTYLIKLYEERGKSEKADLHCQAISRLRPFAGVDGYKPLYKRQPIYPASAQRAGRSGFVIVDFTVTKSGTVTNASVIEAEGGRDLEKAALKAVLNFRYAPAVQDGALIETPGVRNLITFEMTDE